MISKDLYRFCGKARKYIAYGVLASCLRLLCAIAFSYTFVYILGNLINGDLPRAFVFLALPLIMVLKQVFIRLAEDFNFKIVAEVKHNLRKAIYEKVLGLGLSYREHLWAICF